MNERFIHMDEEIFPLQNAGESTLMEKVFPSKSHKEPAAQGNRQLY